MLKIVTSTPRPPCHSDTAIRGSLESTKPEASALGFSQTWHLAAPRSGRRDLEEFGSSVSQGDSRNQIAWGCSEQLENLSSHRLNRPTVANRTRVTNSSVIRRMSPTLVTTPSKTKTGGSGNELIQVGSWERVLTKVTREASGS